MLLFVERGFNFGHEFGDELGRTSDDLGGGEDGLLLDVGAGVADDGDDQRRDFFAELSSAYLTKHRKSERDDVIVLNEQPPTELVRSMRMRLVAIMSSSLRSWKSWVRPTCNGWWVPR